MYENNLKALRTFHPDVAEQIDKISDLKMDVRFNDFGNPNLYIENSEGIFQPCYSEDNLLADFDAFYKTLNEKKGFAQCVLGSGLCIHIKAVLDRLGKDIFIVLFESKPEILKRAMTAIDLTAVFTHPLIKIVTGEKFDIPDLFSSDDAKLLSHNGYNFIEFGSLTSLDPAWYENIKKTIQQYFIKLNESKKVIQHAGEILFSNRFKNLFSMMNSKPVDILRGAFFNKPAVIVASGPSLEKNIDQLTNTDEYLIIAVDSAVAPLMKRNIRPDYIISADFRDMTYEKLAPFAEKLSECRLIYFSEVTPTIPSYINFIEKYYLFLESAPIGLFRDLLQNNFSGLQDAQSVVHGAIHVAQIMGCNPVIFIGLDLAFSGEKDHAEGTILHWGNKNNDESGKILIEGIDGNPVYSGAGFIAQKEICERLIANNPECKFVDASEGGVKVDGTEIMPLKQALSSIDVLNDRLQKENTSFQYQAIDAGMLYDNLKRLKKDVLNAIEMIKCYNESNIIVQDFISAGQLPKKISQIKKSVKNHILKMDSINIKLNGNTLIDLLKELMGKSFGQYFNATLDDGEGDDLSGEMRQLLSDIRQQVLVQKMRFDAVTIFLEMVNMQITFISELKKINQGNDDKLPNIELAKYFYEHKQLTMAEEIFSSEKNNPEVDFYLGCIHVEKGNIHKGQKFFESAVSIEPSYLKKKEAFIKRLENSLLPNDYFTALRKIKIDKILKIDPENEKVWQILQSDTVVTVVQLICDNKTEEAVIKLEQLWDSSKIPNSEYAVLFMFISLCTGRYERLSKILVSVSKNKDWKKERKKHYDNCLLMLDQNCFDLLSDINISQLINWAKKEEERLVFLQGIFVSCFRNDVWKLLSFEKDENFLKEFSLKLETWSAIKEFIPEWFAFKSLLSKNSGDLSYALSEINISLTTGKNKLINHWNKSDILVYKTIICSESGDDDTAHIILRKALEIKLKISFLMLDIFFLLKKENFKEVEQKISNIQFLEYDEDQLVYLEHIRKLHMNNTLKPIIIELSIACPNPVSANGLLAGFCFTSQKEMRNQFLKLTKNIVFNSKLELDARTTPLLIEFVNEVWWADKETIIDGNNEEGELLLNRWSDIHYFLSNWHLVNAEFLIKNNRTIEALGILDSIYQEYRNDIEYLKLYVLQLFIFERTDEAISVFEELLTISPESVYILKEVGDNYLADCNYSAALTVYEECLSLMPENYEILFHIGDIYFKFGNFDSAALAFETLLLKEPNHYAAQKKLTEMERFKT